MTRSRRGLLAGAHVVMAANAFAGAWYAVAGAPDVPREWLAGTPFDTYVVPGLVLGGIVGGTQVAAGVALARSAGRAHDVSVAASGVLLAWITTQVAMIGYVSPLQPIVFGWALLALVAAARRSAPLRRPAASHG